MKNELKIPFSISEQRFSVNSIEFLDTDEKNKHDLTDFFQVLHENPAYKTLSSSTHILINSIFIILIVFGVIIFMAVGLNSSPDPYQTDIPDNPTPSYQTNESPPTINESTSKKQFPHHLAVGLYFFCITFVISVFFFAGHEVVRAREFKNLIDFEQEKIQNFKMKTHFKLKIDPIHFKKRFCFSTFLNIYEFVFQIKLTGDSKEVSNLTSNSIKPLEHYDELRTYTDHDSIEYEDDGNNSPFNNRIVQINKRLAKNV